MSSARATAARAPRRDNRRRELLDAAAALFNAHGFDACSVRDIAAAIGMPPGSLYYHFRSKEELFVAVHEEGIRRISEDIDAALAGVDEPWTRLERAAAAHLKAILNDSEYAAVVVRAFPAFDGPARRRLIELRDRYEDVFRGLVEALPLGPDVDRKYFRLVLLGAMNWSQRWFNAGGDAPETIAAEIVELLRAERGGAVAVAHQSGSELIGTALDSFRSRQRTQGSAPARALTARPAGRSRGLRAVPIDLGAL